jgi:hypothetical protein
MSVCSLGWVGVDLYMDLNVFSMSSGDGSAEAFLTAVSEGT